MAQIQPVDIIAPGAAGLNTEKSSTLLAPQWSTVAKNAIVNNAGRIACRRGWQNQTSNPIAEGSPTIDVVHEYLQEDGTSTIITTALNRIYKNISDYLVGANDITPTSPPTNDDWKFINFNNKVLGFQRGQTPITWAGSGDFTAASYTGTGPDGNEALAAFGRIWAVDADLQTIRISALLDETDYSSASGGATLDMSSVWTGGMDEVVALAAVGSNFVVFGKNHIVLWEDGTGSEIGLSPYTMQVADTIEGTGCIARDSVQAIGEGDLLFLSRHGIQSLGRVIQFKSNPVTSITANVRSDILGVISNQRGVDTELDDVRSVFSPEYGFYILNFPNSNTQYVLDTHHPFKDEEGSFVYPVTKWQLGGSIVGMCATLAGKLYFGSVGIVGAYGGFLDNAETYEFDFKTGWLDFGELNHRLKMLKEIVATVQTGQTTAVWNWEFDFSGETLSRSYTYASAGSAEWGIAEWGVGEWSGSFLLQRKTFPAHSEGQFLRLGTTVTINGANFVIQQMSIAPKIGRMVT